jgi:hypothetical protein
LQLRQPRNGGDHDHVRRRTDQFCRSSLCTVVIAGAPAILDAQVAAVVPAQPLQRVEERYDAILAFAVGPRIRPSVRRPVEQGPPAARAPRAATLTPLRQAS